MNCSMIRADELRVGDIIKYKGEYWTIVSFKIMDDYVWRTYYKSIVIKKDGYEQTLTTLNSELMETKNRTR